jgi:hypothetical protein
MGAGMLLTKIIGEGETLLDKATAAGNAPAVWYNRSVSPRTA